MKINKLPLAILVPMTFVMGCESDDGLDGLTSLIVSTSIAAGDPNCLYGGQQVNTGIDNNKNGVLELSEVQSEQYICNAEQGSLSIELVGRYASGIFGKSAAEIVDYHPKSQTAYVVNAQNGMVDMIDLSNLPTTAPAESTGLNNLTKTNTLNVKEHIAISGLGRVNSLSLYGDLLAVAIEKSDPQGNATQGLGMVAFYRLSSDELPSFMKAVTVGALPDNVAFNHDGSQLIVANEGEPNPTYTVDPEGSVAVIEIDGLEPAETARIIDFKDFNLGASRHHELSPLIKMNGPGASVAQDLEPEYITVSQDNRFAYVSLQENNAIAVINLVENRVEKINPLGLKNYGLPGNQIDASDKDYRVNLQSYEGVYGLYQPDTIASYRWHDQEFIVTANEGDARDYEGFSEEARAADLRLDPSHPQFFAIQDNAQLGRLKITTSIGDDDGDGDYDKIISYGGRSFSIWSHDGQQVFDSGNQFERITAAILNENFNNHNEESKGDSRSDDKGPEPEALAIAVFDDKKYAFIGLERTSGFMVYDISNPFQVEFIDYVVNRDFEIDFEIGDDEVSGQPDLAGDLGPESIHFIPAEASPTERPLLLIGNEVSGSVSVYQLSFQ